MTSEAVTVTPQYRVDFLFVVVCHGFALWGPKQSLPAASGHVPQSLTPRLRSRPPPPPSSPFVEGSRPLSCSAPTILPYFLCSPNWTNLALDKSFLSCWPRILLWEPPPQFTADPCSPVMSAVNDSGPVTLTSLTRPPPTSQSQRHTPAAWQLLSVPRLAFPVTVVRLPLHHEPLGSRLLQPGPSAAGVHVFTPGPGARSPALRASPGVVEGWTSSEGGDGRRTLGRWQWTRLWGGGWGFRSD